jgi:predicted nucleotidyltransferase
MITDTFQEALKTIFIRHGVLLAYLFGSQAEGRITPQSDIDLAVLLPRSLTAEQRFRTQVALIGDCIQLFHRNDVDVIILNEANPVLAFEVVRNGKVLYEDPKTKPAVDFAVYTLSRYADTAPLRELQDQYLFERLEQRRTARATRAKEVT